MKVGKKITALGIIVLLLALSTSMTVFADDDDEITSFELVTEVTGMGNFDEFWFDQYGVLHIRNLEQFGVIISEGPLQGNTASLISVDNNLVLGYGLALWYGSIDGTFLGEEASCEGWSKTKIYEGWAIGHQYAIGQGALEDYLVETTIVGEPGQPFATTTINLYEIDSIDTFDFVYNWDVVGDAAETIIDPTGIWQLYQTPHYGSVITDDEDYSGDMYLLSDLHLWDDLLAPTTFNGIGWGDLSFDGVYNDDKAHFDGELCFIIDDFYVFGYFFGFVGKDIKRNDFKNSFVFGTTEGPLGGPYSFHLTIVELD
ncbi:MAG: hypothetical protein ACXAAM_05580 [Candidatus Heimdallarchaeaceae archaeon]|jgi:hypothetical protein